MLYQRLRLASSVHRADVCPVRLDAWARQRLRRFRPVSIITLAASFLLCTCTLLVTVPKTVTQHVSESAKRAVTYIAATGLVSLGLCNGVFSQFLSSQVYLGAWFYQLNAVSKAWTVQRNILNVSDCLVHHCAYALGSCATDVHFRRSASTPAECHGVSCGEAEYS